VTNAHEKSKLTPQAGEIAFFMRHVVIGEYDHDGSSSVGRENSRICSTQQTRTVYDWYYFSRPDF